MDGIVRRAEGSLDKIQIIAFCYARKVSALIHHPSLLSLTLSPSPSSSSSLPLASMAGDPSLQKPPLPPDPVAPLHPSQFPPLPGSPSSPPLQFGTSPFPAFPWTFRNKGLEIVAFSTTESNPADVAHCSFTTMDISPTKDSGATLDTSSEAGLPIKQSLPSVNLPAKEISQLVPTKRTLSTQISRNVVTVQKPRSGNTTLKMGLMEFHATKSAAHPQGVVSASSDSTQPLSEADLPPQKVSENLKSQTKTFPQDKNPSSGVPASGPSSATGPAGSLPRSWADKAKLGTDSKPLTNWFCSAPFSSESATKTLSSHFDAPVNLLALAIQHPSSRSMNLIFGSNDELVSSEGFSTGGFSTNQKSGPSYFNAKKRKNTNLSRRDSLSPPVSANPFACLANQLELLAPELSADRYCRYLARSIILPDASEPPEPPVEGSNTPVMGSSLQDGKKSF
ncbi:hypothetical protein Bca4012_067040 [Brassica carinata]